MGARGPLRGSPMVARRSGPDSLGDRAFLMDYRAIYEFSQRLVAVGFVLTVVEWIGSRFLVPVIGTVGIPILRKRLPTSPEVRMPIGSGTRLIAGIRVRPAGVGEALVFSSMSRTSFFSIHTPCPLKCSLTRLRESQEFLLVGRFPIGFGLFVVGWAAPFVAAGDTGMSVVGGLLFVVCLVIEYVRAQSKGEDLVRALKEPVRSAA